MTVSKARAAALDALEKCRRDGAWSGAVIDSAIKKAGLDGRDAALSSRLILGVLQNDKLCDFYIDSFSGGKKLEPKLRDILRLGVYQLIFLDKIPARAAVNESVELCASAGLKRASGLTNAVLRRVSESKNNLPSIPNEGSAEYLSVKYSHPLWLTRRIIDERGYDFAERFFACSNEPPKLNLQINTLKVSAADYTRALDRLEIEYAVSGVDGSSVELDGCNVATLPGFEEGLFYVQDNAARAAVEIANVKSGEKVLDACAAPGGKSLAAAIKMENTGEIIACDISEKKLRLIKENARRLGTDIIKTECNDARVHRADFVGTFDTVIADVPCSGIGVIRKKPEIRRKTEDEIKGLPAIQLDILNQLAEYVKPGGTLLYSTCTVLKCENEGVVEAFLSENPEFSLVPFKVGNISGESGTYTFWPNTDGTDGFFAAKLLKNK